VRGHFSKVCDCRDPETGKKLGKECPKRGQARHGSWMFVVGVKGPDGKRRQVHRQGFATKAAAEAELERIVGMARDGVLIDEKLTLAQWLDTWLEAKTAGSGISGVGKPLRPTTARSYESHVRLYLRPLLGHVPLAKLRSEQIAAAYTKILESTPERPMSASTLRRIHATLSSALVAAVRSRRLDRNPAEYVDLPTVRPNHVQPWTPEELGRFLDFAASDRLGPVFELMAGTGLRRGEALGLRWSDVDLDRGAITVNQQLIQLSASKGSPCELCGGHARVAAGPPKTAAGERRQVAIGASSRHALLAARNVQTQEREEFGDAYADHGLVFAWPDGSPYSPDYVTARFVALVKASGERPVRLHDLRHGAASLMLAAGVPMAVVSKRLGHSQISLTINLYSHLLPETDRAAAEATEALIPRQERSGNVTALGGA